MAHFTLFSWVLAFPVDAGAPGLAQWAIFLASIVISCLQLIVVLGLGYYYLLLVASIPRPKAVKAELLPNKTFAIAIPAHNEEAVLAETIKLLRKQNYPSHLFDIFVVADHCDDNTAEIARKNGAICYERSEAPRGRKAYALQWLLEQILNAEREYDALVIFDADSHVDPGFLQAMGQALAQNRRVCQGHHVIANPQESRYSGLAALDMRLNNLLRNRAKQNLGLSCRLMGDAMCFAATVVRQFNWPAGSLVEDREYGLYLLTQGIRISYVPEAVSFGQAAPGWKEASFQRLRWYGGVFYIQKKFAFKLFKLGLRCGNLAALDQSLELLLPPLSVLVLLPICITMAQWIWPALHPLFPLPLSVIIVGTWMLFPFLGLWVDGAPLSAYQSLLYGPVYLFWRLWLGCQARIRGRQIQWIRTRRHEEISPQTPKV